MKNKIIRKIALNLAFFQLFSVGLNTSHAEDHKILIRDEIISDSYSDLYDNIFKLTNDNNNCPVYQRLDTDTGEYHPISIFDYENITDKQYGANQQVFRTNFKNLIEDPLIFEEMQNYYPVNIFDSEEEAMFFYEKYFDIIYDCGCGYAAAANYVFKLFEGREEEFYKHFGYPMYKINNNTIDFNYELFMLKFFNYSVKYGYRISDKIIKSMQKDLNEFKLKDYIEKSKIKKPTRQESYSWTDKQWDEYYKLDRERDKKIAELSKKYKNSKNVYYNFGIELSATFGYLYVYLADNHVRINSRITSGLGKPNVNEIVASDGFTLTKVDPFGNTSEEKSYESHYVYITEIKADGLIIVSSWGDMYIFNDDNASWTNKVILKLSK